MSHSLLDAVTNILLTLVLPCGILFVILRAFLRRRTVDLRCPSCGRKAVLAGVKCESCAREDADA